jgi:F0F1-type ATP synthase membrane subunit b/b'
MSSQETKAYEDKINAQLHEAKAQLGEFESRAKGKASQTEIDTINRLKSKHQEIDRKRQELKTAGDAKFGQVKAEIDADVAKLKTSLADLGSKLKKAG